MEIHIAVSETTIKVGVHSIGKQKTKHFKRSNTVFKKQEAHEYAAITFKEPQNGTVYSGMCLRPDKITEELRTLRDFTTYIMLCRKEDRQGIHLAKLITRTVIEAEKTRYRNIVCE